MNRYSKGDTRNWPIGVVGDGGWGTTVALYLHRRGYRVRLWGAFPEYVEQVKKRRENSKFLPGVRIPRDMELTADLAEAVADARLVVLATPSQFMRSVCKKIKPLANGGKIWVSLAKGIEVSTLMRMSEVIREEIPARKFCVLSGPSHAEEVAREIPTTAVIASDDARVAQEAQHVFSSEVFRLYRNDDIVGVELGGALKNVVAIAVGISDGMGFGDNTKAALMTRSLDEMSRLGVAMGAKAQTFAGLSGMGDLITTCVSVHSRNRNLGHMIGQGMSLQKALKQSEMVVEGVQTTRSARALAKKYNVDVPIIEEVHAVLFSGKSPKQAVHDLLKRVPEVEFEGKRNHS